jgi:hypothetical protein
MSARLLACGSLAWRGEARLVQRQHVVSQAWVLWCRVLAAVRGPVAAWAACPDGRCMPAGFAPAGGVERAGYQVETLDRGLLGRKMTPGPDRAAAPGLAHSGGPIQAGAIR